ncbi:VWA domain-containing protein [Mesorhizobium sp. 1B3]|uniref:VWA domain-containing protein n=1 Tax=Mesorhizobium sp. 1B3 TaxID=3243599 RepID=UPI003D975EE4
MIGQPILWATPWAFALLPIPLLARWLLRMPAQTEARLVVPDSLVMSTLAGEHETARGRRALAVSLVGWAAWLLLVAALAGPQNLQPASGLPLSGRDIVLAIDFSGSMERKDFFLDNKEARRLDAVKQVGAELLQQRRGDRIGLVVFADSPFIVAMPTFDLDAVATALRDVDIGMVGRSTAIGEGLGLSIKLLNRSQAKSRLVILLSDGTNTAGSVTAESAAGMASRMGVKVHTISLGTDLDERSSSGQGGPKTASALLREIASAGGGEAFRVRSVEDLRAVVGSLNKLEPNEVGNAAVTVPRDLWHFPATLAVLMSVLGHGLGRRL